jgi:glycosidase
MMNIRSTTSLSFLLAGLVFLASFASLSAQTPAADSAIDHVCPPCWWTGMQDPFLQVLFHGPHIAEARISVDYPGVTLKTVHHVENPDYLFADLNIAPATKAGTVIFRFTFPDGRRSAYRFPLSAKSREDGKTRALGVSSADLIYLLMPDRFSDGDTAGDRIPGMLDQSLNRHAIYDRHGGDLKGVADHLDYFTRLGVTALWLNPVIENNEPRASYHGYSFTDHYKVDPRLGTNREYAGLVAAAHARHLKVVQDIVLNHVGDEHWFVKDLPMKDWLNQWPRYTNTNYRESPLFDPYAAAADRKQMSDGWFVPSMPDLNQRNPYVANYLIENAIWWVEYAGIDAYRVDTYIYCDLHFLNRFNAALLKQFPALDIFGETWVHGVSAKAYFTRNRFNIPFKSNLPGAEDFQLNFAIKDAFTGKQGWETGLNGLYTTLAKDFVYQDPSKNVIFLDNHDMDRFLSTVNGNVDKLKSGFAWLLTMRGIPQMYYGDEILMAGRDNPDGKVRQDFPGGWPGDDSDKFTPSGRSPAENDMFRYVSTLAHYRGSHPVLQTGKLMQYVPQNGLYVYFRYNSKNTVMVILNASDRPGKLATARFRERTAGFTRARDIISGNILPLADTLQLKADHSLVLQLMH